MYNTAANRELGLTLIELMVTLAILATISAIAIPAYNGYIKTSYRSECQNEVAAIKLAQEEFFLENNEYFPAGTGTSSGVTTIETASGNLYKSSYTTAAKLAAANCTYAVTSAAGPTYTVTATGANKLATDGVIVTFTK